MFIVCFGVVINYKTIQEHSESPNGSGHSNYQIGVNWTKS